MALAIGVRETPYINAIVAPGSTCVHGKLDARIKIDFVRAFASRGKSAARKVSSAKRLVPVSERRQFLRQFNRRCALTVFTLDRVTPRFGAFTR